MDSRYQQSTNIDYIRYSTVVILPNHVAAAAFMENVYDYCVDVVVYSCDQVYPKNSSLRFSLEQRLATDENLSVIIFGAAHIIKNLPKTKNVFIMDDLIIPDITCGGMTPKVGLELTPVKIGTIIRAFSEQNKKFSIGNSLDQILDFKSTDRSKNPLLYTLLSGRE